MAIKYLIKYWLYACLIFFILTLGICIFGFAQAFLWGCWDDILVYEQRYIYTYYATIVFFSAASVLVFVKLNNKIETGILDEISNDAFYNIPIVSEKIRLSIFHLIVYLNLLVFCFLTLVPPVVAVYVTVQTRSFCN